MLPDAAERLAPEVAVDLLLLDPALEPAHLALNGQGILTRLRQSAGQDVDAGCGQLRAREVPAARVVRIESAA